MKYKSGFGAFALSSLIFGAALIMNGSVISEPAFAAEKDMKLSYKETETFAELALRCVHSEYPNNISHLLNSKYDAKEPHELHPAFYGCYDWHSSVHGHWLLAKLASTYPDAPYYEAAKAALKQSITPENIATEVQYLGAAGRASYERPYGLAWLLQLDAELLSSKDEDLRTLAPILEPLATKSADKLKEWLPKLNYPIRIGEHAQTAFGLGLAYDWAITKGDTEFANLIKERGIKYFGGDKNCPLAYEPDGEAFLSPCLGEASLMARILPQKEFAKWLKEFLPQIPHNGGTEWLKVALVTDRSDPKLAHLDGLNLSRAWMLNKIAHSLPEKDKRRTALENTAKAHGDAALPFITGEHYEGGHWLGTFAIYYITEEGL